MVFFLRLSWCFPVVVKTRSILPRDPGQPSYHPFYHIHSNERSNELLWSHKVIPRREIPFSPLSDKWMCPYPKKYIVKSMIIHTNTNTIYQWWWKSWSLRKLVQPLFSWFSRLPMSATTWQSWRSLRHKSGCTVCQSLRLWIRWVRHRSWEWTETYSFEQTTWQTWCHIELVCCENHNDKCERKCNPPTGWVRWWLWFEICYHRFRCSDDDVTRFCESLSSSPPRFRDMSWKHEFPEK